LLKLPAAIQAGVRDGLISMGHARALVSVADEAEQMRRFNQIHQDGLSVRDLEQLLKKPKTQAPITNLNVSTKLSSLQMVFIEELEKRLAANVSIQKNGKGQGKLIVPFKSDDDFKRIISLLNGE
jgi:ParB family chromosome partitioning protein